MFLLRMKDLDGIKRSLDQATWIGADDGRRLVNHIAAMEAILSDFEKDHGHLLLAGVKEGVLLAKTSLQLSLGTVKGKKHKEAFKKLDVLAATSRGRDTPMAEMRRELEAKTEEVRQLRHHQALLCTALGKAMHALNRVRGAAGFMRDEIDTILEDNGRIVREAQA